MRMTLVDVLLLFFTAIRHSSEPPPRRWGLAAKLFSFLFFLLDEVVEVQCYYTCYLPMVQISLLGVDMVQVLTFRYLCCFPDFYFYLNQYLLPTTFWTIGSQIRIRDIEPNGPTRLPSPPDNGMCFQQM